MLSRGWEVRGVDASPAMLEQARLKFGDQVKLAAADLRALPTYGEFELVISLNDVLNYCTEDGDLERAFSGMRDNLAAGGRICFDLSTLFLFRSNFTGGESEWMGDKGLSWKGVGDTAEPGAVFEAEVFGDSLSTMFTASATGPETTSSARWRRSASSAWARSATTRSRARASSSARLPTRSATIA